MEGFLNGGGGGNPSDTAQIVRDGNNLTFMGYSDKQSLNDIWQFFISHFSILSTYLPENKNKICLVEEWETKKHQEEYFAWRVSTGLTEAIEPYVSDVATTYMDVKQSYWCEIKSLCIEK